MQDKAITTPCKQTPAELRMKVLPTLLVGSPANVDSGIGAMAAYIHRLNILP